MKKIVVFALALSFPGCVSLPRHKADLDIQQLKSDLKYQLLLNQANAVIADLNAKIPAPPAPPAASPAPSAAATTTPTPAPSATPAK